MTDHEASRTGAPLDAVLAIHRSTLDAGEAAVWRASVAPERLADTASVEVGETPSQIVYTENKLELRRYESLTDHQHPVPIVVVYALINRPYILDLQPDRSIVRRLLEAGHDVYLIDWGEPSVLDASLSIHDYVNRYLDNCVDEVRARSGRESVNLLGYCMGGTLSAIYAALHPTKVNALALLATGLCFEDTGGVLERWGDEAYFDPRAMTDTFGTVPGEFLSTGFDLMDPVANAVAKYAVLYDRLENEDFVQNFARMERWLSDSVDVAGEVYAEFVETIYQENRLCENRLTVGGVDVDVRDIDMPLLQIVGEHDHLVPPTASTPFNDLVGTDDVTTIEYPSGHVGLAMSNGAHRDVWPEVAEWFLEQSDRPTLADVLGEGVETALGVDVETDVTVGDVDEVEISLGKGGRVIARDLIRRDAESIERFIEDALDATIRLEVGPAGIVVDVETAEGVTTTVVENVGVALRTEVEEAIDRLDVAARYDLEEVEGIGSTYAGRLRAGGIETVSALAEAAATDVAETTRASERLADTWIQRAQALVEDGTSDATDR